MDFSGRHSSGSVFVVCSWEQGEVWRMHIADTWTAVCVCLAVPCSKLGFIHHKKKAWPVLPNLCWIFDAASRYFEISNSEVCLASTLSALHIGWAWTCEYKMGMRMVQGSVLFQLVNLCLNLHFAVRDTSCKKLGVIKITVSTLFLGIQRSLAAWSLML